MSTEAPKFIPFSDAVIEQALESNWCFDDLQYTIQLANERTMNWQGNAAYDVECARAAQHVKIAQMRFTSSLSWTGMAIAKDLDNRALKQ